MIKYKDGLILTQESIREPLDQDPSEGQDWNWEERWEIAYEILLKVMSA